MFDFPNSPTVGQVATTPAGATFTWDGTKWVGGAGGGFLPLAGGQLTGPLGVNTTIPSGGLAAVEYANTVTVRNVGFNIFPNTAGTGWVRQTVNPGGQLWYDDLSANGFVFSYSAAGTVGSATTPAAIATLSAMGNFQINGNFYAIGTTDGGKSSTQAQFNSTRWRMKVGAGDDAAAGSIDYKGFDANSLSIVGAGTASPNRVVRVYDDLNVVRNVNSVGGQFQVNGRNVTNGSIGFAQGTLGGVGSAGAAVMAGAAQLFTPQSTTRVLVLAVTALSTNTAGMTGNAQLRYGTGSAPAGGAALTGTIISQTQYGSTGMPAALQLSHTLVGIVSSLTIGTQYWFDLASGSVSAGTATFFNWYFTFLEV